MVVRRRRRPGERVSLGASFNLPDDVSPNDPYFNPPEPATCPCGQADVFPGDDCEFCGAHRPTPQEAHDEWQEDNAEWLTGGC